MEAADTTTTMRTRLGRASTGHARARRRWIATAITANAPPADRKAHQPGSVDVAADAGHGNELRLGRRGDVQDRERVVDAGVDVEDQGM